MNGNIYTVKSPEEDTSHQAISSFFLGPHAENYDLFKENVLAILEGQKTARSNYYPKDGIFISENVKNSDTFEQTTQKIKNAVQKASDLLTQHSLPFWSPRYQGHMDGDLSMPAVLGYFMSMMYNANNVTIEVSPLTTIAEMEVGDQLCELFGYNINREQKEFPVAWGHITCGGTVANLESIWSARNLKFYPLSLRKAMEKNAPLSFIASNFMIETCAGPRKMFKDLSNWEMLNLKVHDILEIPDRLYNEYGISSVFLQKVLEKYIIQTTGKDTLEEHFGIKKPIQYMLSTTRHYSWPKGCAITGIGSENVISIPVDDGARVDLKALEEQLQASVDNNQAVYAVVAIIGSTEEGAVDPLRGILALRERFQALGLSFAVHADAAWGGYFCSMLPKDYTPDQVIVAPHQIGGGEGFVPDATLRAETQKDLYALRYADSVTVDPHKAGYVPYPAGGLCYRDERMKYLVTWTSPYISRDGTMEGVGIFGVEGTKPGAAAMSTWLSNKCIGLHPQGYGALLGEVSFTCSRLSAHWAAMSTKDSSFVVVPLNKLPSELKEHSTAEMVEEEKEKIRKRILGKSNAEMVEEDIKRPEDDKAMTLVRALGSDLNINAFACNFRYSDGRLNDDVEEANYFNKRIVERLTVDDPADEPTKIPFFLSSTEFSKDLYGKCLSHFKGRLGLAEDDLPLFVLRNVVMSPFPTEGNFIQDMIKEFQTVVEDEVKFSRKRNEVQSNHHTFVMQGTAKIYLTLRPMFYMASHRRQTIVSATISEEALQKYVEAKKASPTETFILATQGKEDLSIICSDKNDFEAVILTKGGTVITKGAMVKVDSVIKDRPLNSKYRDPDYPSGHMPFYLYGTPSEPHIDHILVRAPNIQLSASSIFLNLDKPLSEDQLARGAILYADNIHEEALQPFLPTKDLLDADAAPFFFRTGQRFTVTVYEDMNEATAAGPGLADIKQDQKEIAKGVITLKGDAFVDSEAVNRDPFKRPSKYPKWKEEFDQIGADL